MKFSNRFKSLCLILSAIASTTVIGVSQAKAVSFEEQQVSQDQLAVVAVPFGDREYRLEIIEQIPGERQCWNESGAAPVKIDLLLQGFDYTTSCKRAIDTNGYTLRLNGEDDRVSRILKIVRDRGELKLIAFDRDSSQPSIEIGSTNGLSDGAMKIILDPGWQITQRVYEGEAINHFYLSGNTGFSPRNYSTSTSSTTVNDNNSSTSSVTPKTTNTLQSSPVDTKALADSVEQIYQNVVTPILRDLSQESTDNR